MNEDKPWSHMEKFTEFFNTCRNYVMDWQILKVETVLMGYSPVTHKVMLISGRDDQIYVPDALDEGPRPSDKSKHT